MGRWESNASNCWQEDAAPCNSSIIYWHNSEMPIHYQGAFWQHWCGPVVWLCILLTFTHCYDLSVVSFSIISSSKISLFNFQYKCLYAFSSRKNIHQWVLTHNPQLSYVQISISPFINGNLGSEKTKDVQSQALSKYAAKWHTAYFPGLPKFWHVTADSAFCGTYNSTDIAVTFSVPVLIWLTGTICWDQGAAAHST